jgi:multicomponent Na+:H+ antiporter subunit G
MTIVANILIGIGLAFITTSTIALLIMPDLYTRAHAVAKSETLGLLLIFGGVFFRPELDLASGARLALILLFSLIANPTAVHALVRAAIRLGARPWTIVDQELADQELERIAR